MEIFGFNTKKVTNKLSWFSGFRRPEFSSRAWFLATVTAFVLLIVVSVFCVVIFTQVQEGTFASSSGGGGVEETVTLDREQLNEAVSNLQKRRATFDLLRDRQPDISNPSQ